MNPEWARSGKALLDAAQQTAEVARPCIPDLRDRR
jgi:hypothetical protein